VFRVVLLVAQDFRFVQLFYNALHFNCVYVFGFLYVHLFLSLGIQRLINLGSVRNVRLIDLVLPRIGTHSVFLVIIRHVVLG
jgi:hypothetical protein